MPFLTHKGLFLLKKAGTFVQTLSIYGACGIVGFGWVLSRLLHFDCGKYAAAWFFAAIFIYNLDRLKSDPADPINTPHRSLDAAKLRKFSFVAAMLSGIALVIIPVLQGDWLMMALAVCGAIFCMNYSLPLLGFRFKDIPLVKTFFAPAIVTAAFLVPPLLPLLQQGTWHVSTDYLTASAWTLCVLLFNMILCDLRDIEGDAATGIKSLPVVLGARRTVHALAGLLAIIVLLSLTTVRESAPDDTMAWKIVGGGMTFYLGGLLAAAWNGKRREEYFYEWWVEGILFVPLLAYPFLR